MDREATVHQVLAWAQNDENIRAVVMIGSYARGQEDQLSDLDLVLYASEPNHLLDQDKWYKQFGEVLVVEALANDGWNPTRLVYYAGGKIDFVILSADPSDRTTTFEHPFRVLLDKDGLATNLRLVSPAPSPAPTRAEFFVCSNWFYAATIMRAKETARGDLWAAKLRDWESNEQLLRMLEWDHRARKGWDLEIRAFGRFLRSWVDPDLLPDIEACWCGTASDEEANAIRTSIALFDKLARRTAGILGFHEIDAAGVAREADRLLGSGNNQDEPDPRM